MEWLEEGHVGVEFQLASSPMTLKTCPCPHAPLGERSPPPLPNVLAAKQSTHGAPQGPSLGVSFSYVPSGDPEPTVSLSRSPQSRLR